MIDDFYIDDDFQTVKWKFEETQLMSCYKQKGQVKETIRLES